MLRPTLFSAPDNNLEKNRLIAKEIIGSVANRFPYGGINISANMIQYYENAEQLNEMVKKIEMFHGKVIPDFSSEFLDVKAGFCDDLSFCGVQFAAKSTQTHSRISWLAASCDVSGRS